MPKYYAYQVAPEYQESPLFQTWNDFPVNVSVFGNPHYKEQKSEKFDWILSRMKQWNLADELYDLIEDSKNIDEMRSLIHECFSGDYMALKPECIKLENIEEMNDSVLLCLVSHIVNTEYETSKYFDERENLCLIVSIITGEKYDYRCIRGSSQGDWNYMYYKVDEWTEDDLRNFEIEYWNEGSECSVYDGEETEYGENFETNVYCHSYDTEDIRKEISDEIECDPGDIVLFEFKGWIKTPKYEMA